MRYIFVFHILRDTFFINFMNKYFYVSLLFVAFLQSCSTYSKVVKSDDYDKKFELANEMYDSKQYIKSVTLYEQVFQRVPKTAQGEISYFRIGKAYFLEDNYYLGGYYLATFPEKYPASTKVEESLFLSTLCSVNNSPSYSLDQNETELALNDLQMFINRFPNSNLVDTCNILMDKLLHKLERKDFEMVKLYDKTENYKSALTSASVFLNKHPRSTFKENVHFILVKNTYLLAINSIDSKKSERIEDSIEKYRTFVAEFPETKYKKQMDVFMSRLEEEKKILSNIQK